MTGPGNQKPLTQQLILLGRYWRYRQRQDISNLRQLVVRDLFVMFASRVAGLSRPLSILEQDIHPVFTFDISDGLKIQCGDIKAHDIGKPTGFWDCTPCDHAEYMCQLLLLAVYRTGLVTSVCSAALQPCWLRLHHSRQATSCPGLVCNVCFSSWGSNAFIWLA